MSDSQKLKNCVAEQKKASKELDNKLNKAMNDSRIRREEAAAQSSRQS